MLGWDDHAIMTTPLARLELAIKGRREFVTGILQAVFGKPKSGDPEQEVLESQVPDPAKAAEQLMAWAMRNKQQRHPKK